VQVAVSDTAFERLRSICLSLPEATEKPFGGHTDPTWRVRDKIFAMCDEGHDHASRPSLWCKAPPGAQDVLVGSDPQRFFVPPYVGHNGWVGVWLDGSVDWDFVAGLVADSYRMTAPKRLVALIE
jgi:predicted DNA-binding protein (MmcQ/YjbR family)